MEIHEGPARPPYVRFETRPVEDRVASIEAGHYVAKDVDYALITPHGSKDCIERVVAEWLPQLDQQAAEGRIPVEWPRAFKEGYRAWKEGREAPLSGLAVEQWPVASPAQVKSLLNAKIRTVEDLAQANEESLARIGMGARALKNKAIEWLSAAAGQGRLAERLSALETALADAKARNEELASRNAALQAQVDALKPKETAKS